MHKQTLMTKVMALCCHQQCLNLQAFFVCTCFFPDLITGHCNRSGIQLRDQLFLLDGVGATYHNNVSVLVIMGTVTISIINFWIFLKGA